MKKFVHSSILVSAFTISLSAQVKQHIVYDLSGKDTAAYGAVLEQCNDILQKTPDTELEIVCHEDAIFMLVRDQSSFEPRMSRLKKNGNVSFVACANTMKRFNIDKASLVSCAGTVPVAVVEIAQKKDAGWNYRRTAFDGLKKWPQIDRTEFISSCVAEAKKNILEDKAKVYCECMLYKMQIKYPDPVQASKLTDADIASVEFQKLIKECLK